MYVYIYILCDALATQRVHRVSTKPGVADPRVVGMICLLTGWHGCRNWEGVFPHPVVLNSPVLRCGLWICADARDQNIVTLLCQLRIFFQHVLQISSCVQQENYVNLHCFATSVCCHVMWCEMCALHISRFKNHWHEAQRPLAPFFPVVLTPCWSCGIRCWQLLYPFSFVVSWLHTSNFEFPFGLYFQDPASPPWL